MSALEALQAFGTACSVLLIVTARSDGARAFWTAMLFLNLVGLLT